MPNATATPADRLDLFTGLTLRTCRVCSTEAPLTAENFFHRTDRDGNVTWIDGRCQTCRRQRDAETRRARRANRATGGRKFGVEIEYIGNRDLVAAAMNRLGVSCRVEGYNHSVGTGWKIVTDASVNGGYELVSPPLQGAAGIAQLKVACQALEEAGARVNRACGLHIHHDVSDLDTRSFGRLFRAWSNNQRNTDGLVAASRRDVNWARALSESEVRRCETVPAMDNLSVRRHFPYVDRYRSLNVAAFIRYGTVEVRQHQGSLNFDKIAAWIAYGQAIITLAKSDAPTTAAPSTDAFLDTLAGHGLTAAQVTYLKARAAHFAGRPVAA